MVDRAPTKPNRYAVYDENHNFIRYEYHERADEPTQEGDALNKANLLPDDVASALGLTGNPQVKDALQACAPWKLLQVYSVAGSYTFTPPSWCKEIGAFIIGGGGSGTACRYPDLTKLIMSGGASGRSNRAIIGQPLTQYAVVVGAGGAAKVASTNTDTPLNGANGGASSFAGVTAAGGEGGKWRSPASGGQGSVCMYSLPLEELVQVAPAAFGEIRGTMPSSGLVSGMGTTFPQECKNPFDGKRLLISGGGAAYQSSYSNYYLESLVISDDYGNSGSIAVVVSSGSGAATAAKGTSYGCGGGVAFSYGGVATSAAGCDGAVLIYGR